MISEQKTNGYIKEENMTDRGGGEGGGGGSKGLGLTRGHTPHYLPSLKPQGHSYQTGVGLPRRGEGLPASAQINPKR